VARTIYRAAACTFAPRPLGFRFRTEDTSLGRGGPGVDQEVNEAPNEFRARVCLGLPARPVRKRFSRLRRELSVSLRSHDWEVKTQVGRGGYSAPACR
jgi:hypothetical protein